MRTKSDSLRVQGKGKQLSFQFADGDFKRASGKTKQKKISLCQSSSLSNAAGLAFVKSQRRVTCHDSLSKVVLRGTLASGRRRGGQSGGKAGRTTLKNGCPYPFRNSSLWLLAGKTGRGSLPNRPSGLPDDATGRRTELNRTERSECCE